MPALSEWIRDELRAHVRDVGAFQPTDFVWKWSDVTFTPTSGMIADAALTPQRKTMLECTHRDDPAIEFRVTAVQRGNTHEFSLECEYQPALMFTLARVPIDDPTQIKRPMTEWLAVVVRQLAQTPSISRRVDELVDAIAGKLSGDEPFSEPHRARLSAKLNQVAALTLVLREGADTALKTSLADAHRDAKYLADHLAEISRRRAMRWIVGTIARVDYAWQLSGKDEPHRGLQELWELADLPPLLGEDYRTRARLEVK